MWGFSSPDCITSDSLKQGPERAKVCSYKDQGSDCAFSLVFSSEHPEFLYLMFSAVKAATDPHIPNQFLDESDLSQYPLLADSFIIYVRKLSLMYSKLC